MPPEPAGGSDPPTTAQIRHAIDAGGAGDKVAVFDPAAAPLGTDEEAAGTPPSAAERRLAADSEMRGATPRPGREVNPRGPGLGMGIALGVAAALILALLLSLAL